MPSGKGQPSPAPSKRLNVSRAVEAAMPSRRAISRVEIPAENFKRMISRTWRIATLSAGIIAPLDCQRKDPKQASGGARRHSRPRAALFRSGGRHHLVMVGGIIPLRRATSSRYDGRLGQESAAQSARSCQRVPFGAEGGEKAGTGREFETPSRGASRTGEIDGQIIGKRPQRPHCGDMLAQCFGTETVPTAANI